MLVLRTHLFIFFFNDTATTEIYTLSLHDALPISLASHFCSRSSISIQKNNGSASCRGLFAGVCDGNAQGACLGFAARRNARSEEHTSELQSLAYLVCRLLLEKKNRSS